MRWRWGEVRDIETTTASRQLFSESEKHPHFFAVLLSSKDFAHGHTTSILSTETCLFHYFEAEKTPGLISLVVDEAETMERLRASNYSKSKLQLLRHS